MKQTKKNYGKKPTTTVSKQSTNGNKGNVLVTDTRRSSYVLPSFLLVLEE